MTADRATAGPRSGKQIGEETHFSGQQPRAVQKALGMARGGGSSGTGKQQRRRSPLFAGVPSATAYRDAESAGGGGLSRAGAGPVRVRVGASDCRALACGVVEWSGAHAARARRGHADTHEVSDCTSASFAGGRLRFVDKDPDHEIIGIAALPKNLHANALGKVLLAHDERLLPGLDLRRVTEFTIGDFDILSEQLRSVRRQGFAFEDQECRLGRSAVAVPVRDHADQVAGGLCVQGASGRVTEGDRELVGFLFDCARQLTGLL